MRAVVAVAVLSVVAIGCGEAQPSCPSAQLPDCTLVNVISDGGYTACYDVGTEAVCEAGQWKCPKGSVPYDQCDCEGAAPGPRSCSNPPDSGASDG